MPLVSNRGAFCCLRGRFCWMRGWGGSDNDASVPEQTDNVTDNTGGDTDNFDPHEEGRSYWGRKFVDVYIRQTGNYKASEMSFYAREAHKNSSSTLRTEYSGLTAGGSGRKIRLNNGLTASESKLAEQAKIRAYGL